MEHLVGIAAGLGLAAAAGLRVFLPLFVLGVAGASGVLPVAEGWGWVAHPLALSMLGTATLLEIAAYYVPWLDHALDTLASPAAVVAGMVATAAVLVDLPPPLKWSIVLIGGGGAAGLTQGASVLARLSSGATTGGLGNPVVSTAEWAGALLLALLAVLLPIAGIVVVITLLVVITRRTGRLMFGRRTGALGSATAASAAASPRRNSE